MSLRCPELNEIDSTNNIFDPRCATMVFKTYPREFNNIKEEILNHINKINDPILKYISFYFVQYYIDGYKYYEKSKHLHTDAACQYLKHWLEEKKDLFTYGGKCTKNLTLWESNIEKLWDMLEVEEYHILKDNVEVKSWCKKIPGLSKLTKFPTGVDFS
ncbi:hypothetical protein PCYB_007890 [Plasmodium cynomolgi strain B]|uniref:CYIR protein n=1 Tax=Plasmodium cynomolgi (strain B) TaxID=1120755 RepID=K6V3U4_PLACD|nr:hypothetical protein PCYB_007890 [Plasmodium cynomolgi strain B]GAB70040.1 hypothetical protein PCYB_007890 [Plasmodium cynomolgi strain B]